MNPQQPPFPSQTPAFVAFRPRRLSSTRKKPRTDEAESSEPLGEFAEGTDVEDCQPQCENFEPWVDIEERNVGFRPRRRISKRHANYVEQAEELKHMGLFGTVCLEVVL